MAEQEYQPDLQAPTLVLIPITFNSILYKIYIFILSDTKLPKLLRPLGFDKCLRKAHFEAALADLYKTRYQLHPATSTLKAKD